MDVIAWSQNLDYQTAAQPGARAVSKGHLFAAADVVSIHVVLSGRTRGLVAEQDLRGMKRSAFLVNTSRGPIVDTDALLRALHEGWMRAPAWTSTTLSLSLPTIPSSTPRTWC